MCEAQGSILMRQNKTIIKGIGTKRLKPLKGKKLREINERANDTTIWLRYFLKRKEVESSEKLAVTEIKEKSKANGLLLET